MWSCGPGVSISNEGVPEKAVEKDVTCHTDAFVFIYIHVHLRLRQRSTSSGSYLIMQSLWHQNDVIFKAL